MSIEFIRLTQVNKKDIIELMNNPKVVKHMPLASSKFDDKAYKKFIEEKETIWKKYGFGPFGFIIDKNFIGWGGLQPEQNDIEIAMVLNPNYWGYGRKIYERIINSAFHELKLKSIIILLPPSRKHIKGILKLGFKREALLKIDDVLFYRYRLLNV